MIGDLFGSTFMPKSVARAVLAQRLLQVRKALGISQAELGVRMGLPDDVASTRINRYEKGVHSPDLETAERMAAELGVSLSWLVCTDPKLAEMIDIFCKLDAPTQDKVIGQLSRAVRKDRPSRETSEVLAAPPPKSKPKPVAKAAARRKTSQVPAKKK